MTVRNETASRQKIWDLGRKEQNNCKETWDVGDESLNSIWVILTKHGCWRVAQESCSPCVDARHCHTHSGNTPRLHRKHSDTSGVTSFTDRKWFMKYACQMLNLLNEF